MKTLTVHVSEAEIRDGVEGSPSGCPVALALEMACGLRTHGHAEVGYKWASFPVPESGGGHRTVTCELPEEVSEWIVAFDDGEAMPPITFSLAIPEGQAD